VSQAKNTLAFALACVLLGCSSSAPPEATGGTGAGANGATGATGGSTGSGGASASGGSGAAPSAGSGATGGSQAGSSAVAGSAGTQANGAGGTGATTASGGAAGSVSMGVPSGIGGFTVTLPPGVGTGGETSCGVQSFVRDRKPAEVILVLDRSASMQDPPEGATTQKWDIVEPAVTGIIETTNASISWGLKLYPESQDTDACAAETIVPLIHVPVAANNATNVVGAVIATDPEGDGTPTGDAIKFAAAHLTELSATSDNPKFILLATDGDPSCPEGDSAIAYAVDNISAALTSGFPTFVIGVDTSKESSIERLNAMAMAGGRPRPPESTNPLAPNTAFYLASTQAELTEALQAITGELASCIFTLNPPPPVPDNIAVDFNGVRADRDPTRMNGWEYTTPDHTSLEVYGTWCERIKNEAMNQVEIKYGCPNVPIPLPG
jgi:Mg-chelatase subunit ChlD